MEKRTWDDPKGGREVLFPANPDLAGILGDTDFDFENFDFWDLLDPKFPDFQVPDFQTSRNLAWAQLGPGLGPAWARVWALAWARVWSLAWARAWARLGPGWGLRAPIPSDTGR